MHSTYVISESVARRRLFNKTATYKSKLPAAVVAYGGVGLITNKMQ